MADSLTDPADGKAWAEARFEQAFAESDGRALDVVAVAEAIDRKLPKEYIDDFTLPQIKVIGRRVAARLGLVARASSGNASRGYVAIEVMDFNEFFAAQQDLVSHGLGVFRGVRDNIKTYLDTHEDCPLDYEAFCAALRIPSEADEPEPADA